MLNRCLACSDDEINFILPDNCESFFPNVRFCNPNQFNHNEPLANETNVWGVNYKREGKYYSNN